MATVPTYVNRLLSDLNEAYKRIKTMAQELTDLTNAHEAQKAAMAGATGKINEMSTTIADLRNQLAASADRANDVASLPPITAAMTDSTATLNAAVAAVPASTTC